MQSKNKLEIRKVTMKDFPNHKKKLVVQNIPLEATETQIDNFFFSILAQTSNETYSQNPITAVQKYASLGFVTLEFRKRNEAEICLLLNDVKEF